jgi:hypothetical protein
VGEIRVTNNDHFLFFWFQGKDLPLLRSDAFVFVFVFVSTVQDRERWQATGPSGSGRDAVPCGQGKDRGSHSGAGRLASPPRQPE